MLRISMLFLAISLFFMGCSTIPKKQNWIVKSNKISEEYSLAFAKIYPESGSEIGYQQFDTEAYSPYPGGEEKFFAFYKLWKKKFQVALDQEQDPNIQIDLKIMIDMLDR